MTQGATPAPTPVPASSMVVLRADPRLRVLMVKRSTRARNRAGLCVFPGGRVDAGESPADTAIRELFAEAGQLLAPDSGTHGATHSASVSGLAELRRALNAGRSTFSELVEQLGAAAGCQRRSVSSDSIDPLDHTFARKAPIRCAFLLL